MSWSGIRKAINRAGNQVLVATGRIEHSEDKAFDYEEKRYREMEINSNKLQKEFKHYYDHLNTLTTTQVNIAETLSSFYGQFDSVTTKEETHGSAPGDKYQNFAQEYYQMMRQLSADSSQEVQQPYFQTVLNPVAKFNSYYIEINEAIKKRKHKQLDYDTLKSKVKKLMENPENSIEYEQKLTSNEKELAHAESIYVTLNEQLKNELPKFINYRIAFLDPSFEAFVKIQLQYFNSNFHTLNTLQSKIDTKARQDFVSGKLDERIDDILGKMKQLNITSS